MFDLWQWIGDANIYVQLYYGDLIIMLCPIMAGHIILDLIQVQTLRNRTRSPMDS